jgi:hypothetical protein
MSGEDLSNFNFGFMNHKGQFLSREDALKYAIDQGMIHPNSEAARAGTLTSTMQLLADSSKPGTAIEALKPAAPFYSAAEKAIEAIPQAKMTGEQWLGTLANKPGVKPEELDWTGLKNFLSDKGKEPVTKEQVQAHMNDNKVSLGEVDKGKPALNAAEKEFDSATKDGIPWGKGKLYSDEVKRALINEDLTPADLPENLQGLAKNLIQANKESIPTKYHSYQLPGGENYREKLLTLPEKTDKGLSGWDKITAGSQNYKSSHWDEPNVIAHVRMNDRTIEGKKSLHLEEIQSDWHQQGREKGYRPEQEKKMADLIKQRDDMLKEATTLSPTDARHKEIYAELPKLQTKINDIGSGGVGVPDAPFKKSWHELALKRMLHEAATKGYDRLSWTPGEAQAARYDLSKQIEALHYTKTDKGEYMLAPEAIGGREVPVNNGQPIPKDKIADYVGKEMAEKILNGPSDNGVHTIKGEGLKIGGEGMKGFYDQIIPKAIEKLGKEHGVKVQYNAGKVGRSLEDELKNRGLSEKSFNELSLSQRNKILEKVDAGKPVHYIDIPQSLKDQATKKGFPLFATGLPIPNEGNQ